MANALTADDLTDTSLEPIASVDDLASFFHESVTPVGEGARVGAEVEKFGVFADGEPMGYEGDHGVLALMKELAGAGGWLPEAERAGGPILALKRGGASITLEPGSQFELSGTPLSDCHAIEAELRVHLEELAPFSRRHGVKWLGVGFHPFARRSDYTFVPKQRYPIMREYLPTRGSLALDMMLRTATVQANFDFFSEEDAMRKMRVGLKLAPLTTALFANSPFVEGKPFGGKSMRAKVWLDTDPDRSGLVPILWKKGASFVDYVEWALDVPMFMFKRQGKKIANTGQTFRSFWRSGYQGHRATQPDWKGHLGTLFPEVRLKNTIEIRGADAQGAKMTSTLPALWTGILYDEQALGAVDALTSDWTFEEVSAARSEVGSLGLGAHLRGGTLQPIAEQVLEIAAGGLERRARVSNAGQDERVFLAPLEQLVSRGMTPADALLEGLEDARDLRAEIIARTDLGVGH